MNQHSTSRREQTMFTNDSRIAIAILTLGIVAGATELANAETWNQAHPRRAEVNARLANQNHRINQERREGEITARQARALHGQDRFIRKEERFMAGQNCSHITRSEQRSLNQEENAVSRQVGR
jgi:Ni/Co efflux regulator RcnB